jgi:hypothetical protein
MTQSQLSMLRSQMTGQPMLVQAPQTIFQNIYLSPQALQQAQQQQQQQQQQIVKDDN